MILLLDLNYTLVSNSEDKVNPFTLQVSQEQYRLPLIALSNQCQTILVTARPQKYKDITLKSIQEKTGWTPIDSYFNIFSLPPNELKPKIFKELIAPKHGIDPSNYIAIESNPKTILEYKKIGILCLKVM